MKEKTTFIHDTNVGHVCHRRILFNAQSFKINTRSNGHIRSRSVPPTRKSTSKCVTFYHNVSKVHDDSKNSTTLRRCF